MNRPKTGVFSYFQVSRKPSAKCKVWSHQTEWGVIQPLPGAPESWGQVRSSKQTDSNGMILLPSGSPETWGQVHNSEINIPKDIFQQHADAPEYPPYNLGRVSNGSGPSLRVWVWVGTKLSPNWSSGSSIHPNYQMWYSSMEISEPVWIGRVVSGLSSGSVSRFI